MLSIRLQRTGRKGHAMFRLVVQDSRVTPTSGKVVAALGNYDPHSKTANIDKEKAALYLQNGAQPSGRAALLLQKQGVTLPSWVVVDTTKTGQAKNPEKLRKNQPQDATPAAEPTEEAAPTEEVTETPSEAAPTEAPTEAPAEASEESTPTAEKEAPAEKPAA